MGLYSCFAKCCGSIRDTGYNFTKLVKDSTEVVVSPGFALVFAELVVKYGGADAENNYLGLAIALGTPAIGHMLFSYLENKRVRSSSRPYASLEGGLTQGGTRQVHSFLEHPVLNTLKEYIGPGLLAALIFEHVGVDSNLPVIAQDFRARVLVTAVASTFASVFGGRDTQLRNDDKDAVAAEAEGSRLINYGAAADA